MRENICIVLNAKNKKDAQRELHDTIDLFREDCHLDTECESWFTKEMLRSEYEAFKQRYRDLPEDNIQSRLNDWGECPGRFKDIEEYIEYVLGSYGWETLEKYATRYNIVRFEEEKAISIHNPRGYIDYVDSILCLKKYKYLTTKKLKDFGINSLVFKDKTDLIWECGDFDSAEELKERYKRNRRKIKQALNREANNNDYIAIVRVHY